LTRFVFRKGKRDDYRRYQDINLISIDEALSGKIKQLLSENKKIHAIKLAKEKMNLGLLEAKEFIETFEKRTGYGPDIDEKIYSKTAKLTVRMELTEEIKLLLNKGKKLEAIKLLVKESGMGLKEAKDHIELIEENTGMHKP
jgi:ribosomal protein L7/L12